MTNSNGLKKRAMFLTIERPLWPQPLKNSEPYWYGAFDQLAFYELDEKGNYIPDGKGGYKKCFDRYIPEARLAWMYDYRMACDTFDKYGLCEVFYDEHFGWQLRLTISHERARFWLKNMLDYVNKYHNNYHKTKGRQEVDSLKVISNGRILKNSRIKREM